MAVVVQLDKRGFRDVIRLILQSPVEQAKSIRHASYAALKRLGVKRDESKAVAVIPKGSDQVNVASIVLWFDKVQVCNKKAIKQLVAIDATAVARTKG